MSQISLKSISGITSITTPTGADNQFTLHTNNTNEALKLDGAGNLHFHNHLNITGVSTASNFKTGTSNLHNTGLNVQDLDVDGHTNLDNVSIAGVTTFSGDITATGDINANDHINLASGKKLSMAGDVFKIYHSTNAAIINESGDLLINQNVSNKDIKISTGSGPTERLRIDSSGNVLVGTTDASIYNNGDSASEGIVLRGGDVIDIARKGDLQLTLNRQTNDGPHIAFYRSGGVKSYISTRGDAFCIDVG